MTGVQTCALPISSTPQTQAIDDEDSFADGGIARLNSKFDFAGGGIVAFAKPTEDNNNSLVVDPMLGTTQDMSGTDSDDRTILNDLVFLTLKTDALLKRLNALLQSRLLKRKQIKLNKLKLKLRKKKAKPKTNHKA